jgi:hypothetical protein
MVSQFILIKLKKRYFLKTHRNLTNNIKIQKTLNARFQTFITQLSLTEAIDDLDLPSRKNRDSDHYLYFQKLQSLFEIQSSYLSKALTFALLLQSVCLNNLTHTSHLPP